MYIWKILEGYAWNCGVDLFQKNQGLERKIKIPSLYKKKKGRQAIQTMRESTFQIYGTRLFNSLPCNI